MKKHFLLFIFMLTISISTFAQLGIRHVRGIKSVDGYYGVSKFGSLYGVSYVKYFSNKLYGKISGYSESGKQSNVTYRSSGMDVSVAYNILKPNESIYINGIGGLTASFDATEKTTPYKIAGTLKYGSLLGIETEFFITDKFVFLVHWDERFLLQQNFGTYRWYAVGGIRYNF